MWSIEKMKNRGWNSLKGRYWISYIAGLILLLGEEEGVTKVIDWVRESSLTVIICTLIVVLLYKVFIGYPLIVGGMKYFIELTTNGTTELSDLLCNFRDGNYTNTVKTMFICKLKIFLWSLLLLIPGIIKSYEYYLVPYILAENPQMDSQEVLALSSQMTDERKFDIFILELSFIGWYILGSICLIVGMTFINPYVYATKAEMYKVLKSTVTQ
ncbi:DUF975 family protein [Lutibacter sp. B2]|nr:DUF975 family protein [Lutibacter sp. B2]